MDRYGRQTILPSFGPGGQEKLSKSRVLVIGAGGLGSPASLYLAAAGVGHLTLVDPDTVDLTNLHRQILYKEVDIGNPKSVTARKALRALNQDIEIQAEAKWFDEDSAPRLTEGHDLIVDCSDNFDTRIIASRMSLRFRLPLIQASVAKFEGQLSVFSGGGAPCYRCLFPVFPVAQNCAEGGVLGALPGIMGSYQALEGIRILTGFGQPSFGTIQKFDALSNRWTKLHISAKPGCEFCSPPGRRDLEIEKASKQNMSNASETDIQIQPSEVARRLAEGEPVLLLDVREPEERVIANLGGEFIPLGELTSRVESLDPSAEWIVYCHHGVRSLQAAVFLRQSGYTRACSMRGGIDRWSLEIDPEIPRY